MAARRSNKRRRKQRGRFGVLYKLMSMLIILVVVVAGCVVFFRVADITVTGQGKYTAEEIIAASGIETGDNLFGLNKGQVYRRIQKELSYIDKVNIRRILPDGVIISVTEHAPAALVRGEQSRWVVDYTGKILEETSLTARTGVAAVTDLAEVTGITAVLPATGTALAVDPKEEDKLQTLLRLTSALQERGMLDRTDAVDLTGTADLVFTFDGRFEVKMPMNANFPRMVRAIENLVAQLQPNEKGTILVTQGESEIRFIAD